MSEIEWIEIFSGNLVSIMTEVGITQGELARDTGISKSLISDYCNGKRMPSTKSLINIIHSIPEMEPEELFRNLVYFDDRIV